MIHLDGTPSGLFYELLEMGELPNIDKLTSPGHQIKYGVSISPENTFDCK